MKYKKGFLLACFVLILLSGCGPTPPQSALPAPTPAPIPTAALEAATRNYYILEDAKLKNPTPTKVRGLNIKAYPNDTYLITVDIGERYNDYLVGQQYTSEGKTYWNVNIANWKRLAILGIDKPAESED